MNELSINIHIAGRVYPITAGPEEEAGLRAAGKLIQDKLQQYNEEFGLRDQQDALAMFALEIANELRKLKEAQTLSEQATTDAFSKMEDLLRGVQL